MIHLLSRNDLNLRKIHILQGAQPIEIVRVARTGSKKVSHIVKNIKRKTEKGLTFVQNADKIKAS